MGLKLEDEMIVLGENNYSGGNSMLTDTHIEEFNEIIKLYSNFSMQSPLLI